MSVSVREAQPADAAALVELARAVAAEPEGWLVTDGRWHTVREERRHLRAARASPHAAVLVAEEGAGLVGRLSVVRESHPGCSHVADIGVMVAREHRGRGVGSALLLAAEEWARRVGVHKLELHVFPYNEAAIALYERRGYRREGYRIRHFRRGSELVDAILMAKELG